MEYESGMRFGGLFIIYIVVGILVAAGVIGNETNYFSDLGSLEEIVEMLLAVLLWPLVLLDVSINIGGAETGGDSGGAESGGGETGGESSGGDSSAGVGGSGGGGGGGN